MAGVDLDAFTIQVFNRLATDAAGSAVRAALGASAAGIIHAEQLKRYTKENPAPTRPLIALRGGAVAGQSFDMRTVPFTWWVYDDPGRRYDRINPLLLLIEQAYPFDCMPFARTAVANIGAETSDSVLGWLVRTIQLALITRG